MNRLSSNLQYANVCKKTPAISATLINYLAELKQLILTQSVKISTLRHIYFDVYCRIRRNLLFLYH